MPIELGKQRLSCPPRPPTWAQLLKPDMGNMQRAAGWSVDGLRAYMVYDAEGEFVGLSRPGGMA